MLIKLIKEKNESAIVRSAVAVIILLFLVLPYILVALYANPSGDDYAFLAGTINQASDNWLIKAGLQAKDMYFLWQGTYFTNLLNPLFIAALEFGGLLGLHLEFIFGITFFAFSLLFLSYRFINVLVAKKTSEALWISILFTAVVWFTALYNFQVGEVFYWHTGLYAYTVPFSFALLSLGMSFNKIEKAGDVVLASLFAFFAVGGSLNIAAFVNFSFVFLIMYCILSKRAWKKPAIIFLSAFIGTIINLLAPGNYVRRDSISEEFHVVDTVLYSIKGVLSRNIGLLFGVSISFAILFLIISYNYVVVSDIRFINPFISLALVLCGEVIVDFPVHLGYANSVFPERCDFISRIIMSLFMILWLINCIGWLAGKDAQKVDFRKPVVYLVVIIAFMACVPFASQDVSNEFYPFVMIKDISTGTLKKYEEANSIIIEALENADNEDIVVDIYDWADIDYLNGMGLSSDPDYWINHETTSYYRNVKSISVNYK